MKYEWLISFRYLKARRKHKFISLISLISIFGIAIGVCALIVVISVMNGFDQDLMQKIMGMNAHMSIERYQGIESYQDLIPNIEQIDNVKSAAPALLGQVIIRCQKRVRGIVIKGIDLPQEQKISDIKNYILKEPKNCLPKEEKNIILGKELAESLNISLGDQIEIISPANLIKEGRKRPIIIKLTVVNIFESGMYEHDSGLAFVDLTIARKIFGIKDDIISHVHVKLKDEGEIKKTKKELQLLLGSRYRVQTWFEQNKNLFSAIQLEKTVMFIILTLIVLVAAFNIVSTLIMIVMEKTKDIGILKALGVPAKDILKIFSLQGFFIGLVGIVFGGCSGLGLCLILKKYNFIKLPNDIYYVTKLPVAINFIDVLLILGFAMIISLLAALYPSYKAARLNPVEALRYE